MFVFNTTYYVKDEQIGGFLHWLRHEYLQKAVETGFLKNPQIYRVMNEATDNQTSYAVQFDIDTLNGLREWKRHHEATLNARFEECFGNQILRFSTILKRVEVNAPEEDERLES